MTATITWTPNPLATIIDIDDESRNILRLHIENDELRGLIFIARRRLEKDHTAQAIEALSAVDGIEAEVEQEFAAYLGALRETHCGDCTCVPSSCLKCGAERALGVRTLEGLTKHTATKIAEAFSEDGSRSLDDAIMALAHYDPKPWPQHQDLWLQCLPGWKEEAREAHAWLVRYQEAHFSR